LRLRLVCPTCNKKLLLNDRYEFVRKLSGSWDANAEVFTVTDTQEPNVQKILKVLTNQELHVLKLFKIEQLILMDLDHPGIPKGYDAFEVKAPAEQVIPCIIMERIEGDTLQEYLNHKGSIDQATAIDWMTQLLNILDYAHSQKLFHRDIKPTNIMRRRDGRLVLIDFGTARHITQTIVNGGSNTVIYSHGYTAPEQLSGKAEVRSDFYALGRTFLHLLMGELPSEWKTFVSKQPISPLFQTILQKLTKPNAADRPKSTKVILKDLKKIKNEPKRKRLKD
jgi:eukaryotic-like serine/threonine-protein kinase